MPKLSIVMPVYNSEKFLSKSIESILCQTFTDWELILVNDGSRDRSLLICYEYAQKDNRIKVIDKENSGAGPTRNRGMDLALGEYIAFPDSDDWMSNNAYEIAVSCMDKENVDLVVFGMRTYVYDDEKAVIKEVVEDDIQPVILKGREECRHHWTNLIQNIDLGSPCNKLYRMSIIRENGLCFPDLRRMQDVVFNIHYYNKISSIQVINENLFNRTWHSADFQRKKMPPTLLDCAITYHRTAITTLEDWGQKDVDHILVFHNSFMSILHTVEFDYLPYEDWSFKNVYRHIKMVNNHPYVRAFLKEYKKLKRKIRKKEIAMLHRWNLLLALYSYKK